MTVRTTAYGGTDWSNEQCTSTDLNDTIKKTGPNIISVHNVASAGVTSATLVGSHIFTPQHDVLVVHYQGNCYGSNDISEGSVFAYVVGGTAPWSTDWYYPATGDLNYIHVGGFAVFISGTHFTKGSSTRINIAADETAAGQYFYYGSYVEGQHRF